MTMQEELFSNRRGGGLLTLFVLVMAVMALVTLVGTAQAADETNAKSWKDITMIYTTDVKGKIEPCG